MQLYDSDRHEELIPEQWNSAKVIEIVNDIFRRTLENFDADTFWPADAKEDASISSNKSIYFGAAGTLWALDQLSNYLNIPLPFDKLDLIKTIHAKYLSEPDTEEVVPSFFLGESGILLLLYKYNLSKDTADRLFEVVQGNIRNVTLEALWGAPGTMIAASYMYEWTGESRWANLFLENARYLIDELKESVSRGELIWTQDMYGHKRRFIGAGHGYFGNIFALLKSLNLLSEAEKDFLLKNIEETTSQLAITFDGLANWAPIISDDSSKLPILQWCHGAPGVITSLESYPRGVSADVEELLVAGGELIWKAGPLKKGIALCHGTDGNGYAFLELYKRTGNSLWLERARKFAMHACGQRNGRFSLFTGELGLGVYLVSCLSGTRLSGT